MAKIENKPLFCGCCFDPIEYDNPFQLEKDEMIGVVCKECKHNIRIAVAHLSFVGVVGCEDSEERSPML